VRVYLILYFTLHCLTQLSAQTENWSLFEKAEFKDVYLEEYGAYASLLKADPELMKLDGTEITIKGYHIPVMEDQLIILSKYPNANCFFCGNAGLESVLEVRMRFKSFRRFKMDEQLTFTGKLKINTTDYNLVSFILEDAVLID